MGSCLACHALPSPADDHDCIEGAHATLREPEHHRRLRGLRRGRVWRSERDADFLELVSPQSEEGGISVTT